MNDAATGYSKLSIALHWIAAVAIVALFFTHEGDRGSFEQAFHVGGGALLGLLLIWRAVRRPLRGFTEKPDQPALLNLVSAIVLWGLIVSIIIVCLTGYLLPWTVGRPLDIFGILAIPSFMEPNRDLHEFFEELHDLAGHAILPLAGLHILGALKHRFIDKDEVMQRMVRAKPGGR